MKQLLRKCVAYILMITMCMLYTLNGYGEIAGLSGGTVTLPPNVKKANRGVRPGWGVRITLGAGSSLHDAGITDLPSNPTQADLDEQFFSIL